MCGNTTQQTKAVSEGVMSVDGGTDSLRDLANEVAGVSSPKTQNKLNRLSGKVENKATTKNVGKLYKAVGKAFTAQNKADIAKSLVRKNVDSKTANAVADAIATAASGKQLSYKQQALLAEYRSYAPVNNAIQNIVLNEQSTMGQRNQKLGSLTTTAAVTKAVEDYKAKAAKEAKKNAKEDVKAASINLPESHFDVSELDGKTVDSQGNEIVITGVESIKDGKMILKTENGTVDASEVGYASEDEALIYETVASMGVSAEGANTLIKGFNPESGISASVYANGINEAYQYGQMGARFTDISPHGFAVELNESLRKYAYNLGEIALATQNAKEYNKITTNEGAKSDDTGEGIHLRRGVQRIDSEGSSGSVRGVVEGTGAVPNRQEETPRRPGDGSKDPGKTQGQVSSKELGVPFGTEDRNLSYAFEDTTEIKEAKAFAEQHGLELVAFVGGNLTINSEDGTFEARAYIYGNKVVVRADHPNFSLMQLLKHEIGHDKIRKGNVDMKKVYDAIVDFATEEYVQHVIESYVAAYASLTGYDVDYILEEILCDYEAGMNIFSKENVPDSFWEMSQKILESDAVKQDSVRGPPADVMFSRSRRGRSIELETMENNRFQRLRQFGDDLPSQWYAYTRDFFYIYSNQSFMDYTILAKVSITSKNRVAINNFMEALEDGTYKYTEAFNSWASCFRRGKGRYTWDSVRNGNRGTAVPANGVDVRKRDGKHDRNTEEGSRPGENEIKFSHEVSFNVDTETIINQSMTMQQAKDMVQRAFVTGEIKEFYDGQYRNGDEWLAGEGVGEVAFYIENEYSIVNKYLNHIQEYIDGDIELSDILNAYLGKTLTGKVKQPTQWMDLSHDVAVADKRFYAPKAVKDATAKLEIAKQRITGSNRAEVTKARAEILLYAHNKGAAETLGLTEAEMNRLLRTWSGYRAAARDISRMLNSGIALSNRWSGIENCSWLNKAQVSENELARLVKSVSGDSKGFERNYIARTMLALDTHIDWSDINFVFTGVVDPNRRSVRGTYSHRERTIRANYHSPDTVAHEMGHALDHKWANELGFGDNCTMTEGRLNVSLIKTEEQRLWYSHFQEFIQDLTDSADISSSYTMDNGEVFARFVSTFVQWADQTATGHQNYGYISSGRNDKFTGKQYIAFVKLLQEKAMLDSKAMAAVMQEPKFSREQMEGGNTNDTRRVQSRVEKTKNSILGNDRQRVDGQKNRGNGTGVPGNQGKVWGELSKNIQRRIISSVGATINHSDNYDEVRLLLSALVDKPVIDITLQDKEQAISILAQKIYADVLIHPVIAEQKWSILGNDIGKLVAEIQGIRGSTDIRYSREFVQAHITEKESVLENANKQLEKENAKLQEDNQYLRELVKIQKTLTGGTKFTKSSVEAAAKALKAKANANGDTKALAKLLEDFYGYIAKGNEITWESVMEQAQPVVDWLMQNEKKSFERDRYAQEALDYIKGRSFYMDETQKAEAKYAYGSYQAFRQKLLGTINVSDKANMSLDSFWKEMSEEYPYYFPAEITSGDQVTTLVNVLNTLRNAGAQTGDIYGYDK